MRVFGNGFFRKNPRYIVRNFNKLEKLDSVIKESIHFRGGDAGTYPSASLHNQLLME